VRSLVCTIALGLAGCGFSAAPAVEPPAEPDAGVVPELDARPIARRCALSDPSLRLCIDFEDASAPAADASGRGHQMTYAEALSTVPRADELAVTLSDESRLLVAEHPDLDIRAGLTTSLWMRAEDRERRMWLLDNNRQYAMSYQTNGTLRCIAGSDIVDSVTRILDDDWHHVACTFDGASLRVYIDGSVAGCLPLSRELAIDGGEGLAIGANVGAGPTFSERFTGGMDNVQVLASAWNPAQLCAAAGRTGCNAACPIDTDDDEEDD